MATRSDGGKRQLGGELVIPALSIVFTFYFFSTIWDSPWTAQVSAFLVGGILLLVCAIFIARAMAILRRGEGTLGFANIFSKDDFYSGRVGLFLTTLGYCVFIDRLGFTLTTFLFLGLSMLLLSRGKNAGFVALVAALMSLGGWAVFIWAFDTRFPRVLFETTMKAVLGNG